MKTIRFVSSDESHKKFASTVRKNVNQYFKENSISTKGNSEMVIKAVIMLAFYLAPFVLILTLPMGYWSALLLVLLMGFSKAGIGMSVMHDAAHGAFSDKKWVNNLFESTIYLLGSSPYSWKVQHNILHHTFTNVYGFDRDIDTKAVIRLCDHAPLKKFHRFQHIYAFFFYGLMIISRLVSDFTQLAEFNKCGITRDQQLSARKEMAKIIVGKTLYLLVLIGLPILLTGFSWWQVLIGFALLNVTAGIIMSTIFQMAHVVEGTEQPLPNADGVITDEWAEHELKTTADFARNNFFLNWYAGGLNFQIEHHLFPNTCHIHYRKIAPIVEKAALEAGFTYNLKPSFTQALFSHARRLKALGRA